MFYTKDHENIKNDPLNEIGDYTYGPLNIARAYGGCKLTVGKFCSFGQGITIAFYGRHNFEDISDYPFAHIHDAGWPPVTCSPVDGEDITIGNDVWVGHNAIIMQGADVSDGAVIGAYSIVAGYVPPYSIVVGNPAKEIKRRFNPYQIDMLMRIKWWNWPIELIRHHLQAISSPDVQKLWEIYQEEREIGRIP